jgi:hypothetical protein
MKEKTKKLNTYVKAIWAIAEKPAMTLIGLGLIVGALLKLESGDLRLIASITGGISLFFGIAPMFVAFAKDNWPKK